METEQYPQPTVEGVAAFRWFANRIENAALETYMSNPSVQQQLAEVLLRTVKEIETMEIKKEGFADCPPGWCPDAGRCMPCMDPR